MTKDQLMTISDIAELYRVGREHARDTIVKRKDFPKPIPASSRKNPLWLKDRIEAFIRGEPTHI